MTEPIVIKVRLDKTVAKSEAEKLRKELGVINKEVLTDAQIAKRAELEMIKKANKERVDNAIKAAEAEQEALKATGETIVDTTKKLLSFGAGFVGLSSAAAVVSGIVEYFKAINKEIFESAKFIEDYRKAILELAKLKNQMGHTTKTLGEELSFRSQTLQTKEEAIEFQSIGLGIGLASVQAGVISEPEMKKALIYGGAFQAAEHGDAAAHATLAGVLPQIMGGKGIKGEDVERRKAQLYSIFQGGGPKFQQLIPQFTDLASYMSPTTGAYKDTELAALMAAFSTTKLGSGKAGTTVEQFTTATLGGVDRTGKPRITGAEGQGEYLKKLGVTDKMLKETPRTQLAFKIADLITADLEKKQKEAEAKGEQFHPSVYLKHEGYAHLQSLDALLAYSDVKRSGVLKGFMDLARPEKAPTFAEARAEVEKFQRTDPGAQAMTANLAAELSNFSPEAIKAEFYKHLFTVAQGRVRQNDPGAPAFSQELMDLTPFDPSELFLGRRSKMEREATEMLQEEADRISPKLGASMRIARTRESASGARYMGSLSREQLFEFGQKIQEQGGTAVPGMAPLLAGAQKGLAVSSAFEGEGLAEWNYNEDKSIGGGAGLGGAINDLLKVNTEQLKVLKDVAAPGVPGPLIPDQKAQRR